MSEQLPLFGAEPAPLPAPSRPARAKSSEPPRWVKHSAVIKRRCDDCCRLAYERLQEGHLSTLGIRQARHERIQGGQRLLLCHEHARQRRAEDGLED